MSDWTRREVLGFGTLAGLAGLAGCNAGGTATTSGPQSTDAEPTAETTATSRQEASLYPKEVTVSGTADALGLWVLPGPRRLDERIFGTPDRPKGFEKGIGVPLDARETNADGTAYTGRRTRHRSPTRCGR